MKLTDLAIPGFLVIIGKLSGITEEEEVPPLSANFHVYLKQAL